MDIDDLNDKARRFFEDNGFKSGSYALLQETKIWKRAKTLHILNRLDNGRLYCDVCDKRIRKPIKCVMHHYEYNWDNIFDGNIIGLVHYKCHQKQHIFGLY